MSSHRRSPLKKRPRSSVYQKSQFRIDQQKKVIIYWITRGKSFSFGCSKADISYTAANVWRREDAEFSIACEDAYQVGTEGLEDIADGRAKRRSDTLLMFLLKGRDPKYRDSAKVNVVLEAPKINARRF